MGAHASGISWSRCEKPKGDDRYSYRLSPPSGRYFPTDESIRTVLARHKGAGLSFKCCVRYEDGREVLFLHTQTPSSLAKHASPERKQKAERLIRALARACPKKRPTYLFEQLKRIPKGGR